MGQALFGKKTDFNFSHIQPGGVNGCVVNLQALCKPSSSVRVKGFIQRSDGVDIQIIHDQHNFFTVVIMGFYQFAQEMGKIQYCSGVDQLYHSDRKSVV